MKKKLMYLFFVMFSIIYLNCATILTGTSDRVLFETTPEGAKVYIDGLDEGVTPTTVRVKRSMNDVEVTFKLDGYEPKTFKLKKEFNFVTVLNLIEPVGWLIDVATGSIFKYIPKGYHHELEIKKTENK